jgi:hypothetical protein
MATTSMGEFFAQHGKDDGDGEPLPAGTYHGKVASAFVAKSGTTIVAKYLVLSGPYTGQTITVFFAATPKASGMLYKKCRSFGLPAEFLDSLATQLTDIADALEGREGQMQVSIFETKDGGQSNSIESFELTGTPPPLPTQGGVPAAQVPAPQMETVPQVQQATPVLPVTGTPDPIAAAEAALAAAKTQAALDQAAVTAEHTTTPVPVVAEPSF